MNLTEILKQRLGESKDIVFNTADIYCPKCKELITCSFQVVTFYVKLWLFTIPVKFTFRETYHPACSYMEFRILEIADIQKALKNGTLISGFFTAIEDWIKGAINR